MPTKIYKWTTNKEGKPVRKYLTSREVKAYIMKQNKWTADQYQKQYDIFKNKVRAYEAYQRAQGIKEAPQNISELLYREAKAKHMYGKEYKPSQKLEQIKGFTAYSITKGRQKAQEKAYLEKQSKKYGDYINRRFGPFIKNNEGAQEIQQAFIDDAEAKGEPINYAKMEVALSDYADMLGYQNISKKELESQEAIPVSSEVYGSGDAVEDFDVSDYL